MWRNAHGFHLPRDYAMQCKLLVAALASSVATPSGSERDHTTLVPIGMHSARWLGPQRPLWRPAKSLFPISRRTRSACCLAGLAKGTTWAEAMGTGLGRRSSKRAETKVLKAAGSRFQLETVRARCHLQVVLPVVVCRRFPTCPSISSGHP
jgi:hypothetical protein